MPFIISFHKNIRGREKKCIKRIEEEAKESLGFEELGAKVKPNLGFVKLEVSGMVSFS
jgi:hypothetical protein